MRAHTPQTQATQHRSVQEWLVSRRQGGMFNDGTGSSNWQSTNTTLMPLPPKTAYGGDGRMAAGTKIMKGFPASRGPSSTNSTPRGSFAAQFMAEKRAPQQL